MQKRKDVYITADSEHYFDLSGLISAVGVTDIYAKPSRGIPGDMAMEKRWPLAAIFLVLHATQD